MNSEKVLREQLAAFLEGHVAHDTLLDMVKDFPEEDFNTFPPNIDYTFWHLLEHIRFSQKDILDFIVDPKYHEPHWPKDYWPQKDAKATKKDWEKTITDYERDLVELVKLAKDEKQNLFEKLPQGTGQTLLREIMLVFTHNAYHIGEFGILRQVVGNWGKDHK
jgi:uncharacterized damage-inducible protein DinB